MMPIGPSSPVTPGPGSLSDNLRHAASRADVQAVKLLLAAGAGVEPDREGRNALHYAAQEGHSEVCKYLAAHGCDVNMQDVTGCTPLLKATSKGAKDAVQALVDVGCLVDLQDEHGNAAIHEACWNGFSQTAELLVKYNCNVCLANKAGFTALHLAAQNGHNECSRVLLYAGCNPDFQNNYGDTALHTAARYGHAGVARILISARCKINEQNKNGDTALHIAAALKRRKIAKILVESGIDIELINKQNEKAADVAKRKEHQEILLIITSYSVPKPSIGHYSSGEHVGVTFKDVMRSDERLEICHEAVSPHKHEAKADKQQKERRFFFFKKKKNKEKTTPTPPAGSKKSGCEPTKPPVQGFFSHYVPRDGVQLYRDLAGNVKQGPIGYAPVCQCGPSLRRLENNISDTHESLQNRIKASHHLLSKRIDHLDMRTTHQAHATEAMVKDRLQNEQEACKARIAERLQEERLQNQTKFEEANANMKEELEYWLNDRLASYGHCLDHHHDDTALPPRNLFFDFPATGRLVRSRSDETLTASDYSGKFRKKDFYASRQAAMQHIRGWDVPAFENVSNTDRSRRRERNNNVIASSNKIITHALVHTNESFQHKETESDAFSSGKNHISPGNVITGCSNTEQAITAGRSSRLPWKQTGQTTPQQANLSKNTYRVTFAKDQQKHVQPSHPKAVSFSPSQGSPDNAANRVHANRQSASRSTHEINPILQHTASTTQHSNLPQQNLPEGGLPNTDIKFSELGDSRIPLLTGQDQKYIDRYARSQSDHQRLGIYEDGYKADIDRARTLSADSVLNEESHLLYSRDIIRSHSAENMLDEDNPRMTNIDNSGYLTDTALRSFSRGNYARYTDNSQSMHNKVTSPPSRATYRYRLSETSANQDDTLHGFPGASSVNSPWQTNNMPCGQTTNQAYRLSQFHKALDSNRQTKATSESNSSSKEFIKPKLLHRSVINNEDNKTNSSELEFTSCGNINQAVYPEKSDCINKSDRSVMPSKSHFQSATDCLKHDSLMTSNKKTSPAYASGHTEDSTCSSNQDSGYGSRNYGQGLRRGIDTSVGTPSSSFSTERSSCNTPNQVDSPYVTHSQHSNDRTKTFANSHIATGTAFNSGLQFSPNSNIHSHAGGLRTNSSYTGNIYDKHSSDFRDTFHVSNNSSVPPYVNMSLGDAMSKPVDDTNCNSVYSRSSHVSSPVMHCRAGTQQNQSNHRSPGRPSAGYNSNTHQPVDRQLLDQTANNCVHRSISQKTGNHMDIGERLFYQSSLNNQSVSYRRENDKPPQEQKEQFHKPVLQFSNDTRLLKQDEIIQNTTSNPTGCNLSEGRANNQQQHVDSALPATVQAHIQDWYQRKLKEAAVRLKQSYSYSQKYSEPYVPRNNTSVFQRNNTVNQRHDLLDYPTSSEKSRGVPCQSLTPMTQFETVDRAQTSSQSHLSQFQNSARKNFSEYQTSDSLHNRDQAGASHNTDVYISAHTFV